MDFITAKRVMGAALQPGNPTFDVLPAYFQKRLQPALQTLLEAAATTGATRAGVEAEDLLWAVASLCKPDQDGGSAYARRMMALLLDGLRYGASPSARAPS